MAALRCCEVHEQPLRDCCFSCGKATTWQSGNFEACACGARYDRAQDRIELGSFDRWLGRRLRVLSGATALSELSERSGFDDLFPNVDLQDAIDCAAKVGALLADPLAAPKITLKKGERGAFLDTGFDALSQGESGFIEFLTYLSGARSQGVASQSPSWGVAAAYGSFATWLSSKCDQPAFQKALQLARTHARKSITIKQGSAVFGTTFRRPTASLVEGASACGVGLRRFRKLAVSVDMLPKSKLQGRPASIPIRDVAKLSQRLEGSVTLAGAARMLGVGRHIIPKLIEAGLLHPLEKPTAGPTREKTLENAEIESLIGRLAAACGQHVAYDQWASVTIAAPRSYVSLATALRWILEGKIRAKLQAADQIGLQQFWVDPREVVRGQRNLGGDRRTILDVAKRLNVKWQAVRQLIQAGHLEAEKSSTGWTVAFASLDAFESEFVKAADVATELGMHWSWAPRFLASEGVHPAIDRGRCRSVFYRRKDVKAPIAAAKAAQKMALDNSA